MYVKLKFWLPVLLIASAGYSYLAFAQSDRDLFASIRKAGEVKVASASIPPYQFVSPEGKPKGAGIELQNMVLKAMGLPELTPLWLDWNAMTPGLQAHHFDYVGAGFNITEERCKVVIFSRPFYAALAALHVLPGNPKHLTTVADIARSPDTKLAVISPDLYEDYALKQGVKPDQIVRVPDVTAGVATVVGHRADAYIVSQFAVTDPAKAGVEVVVDKQSPLAASAPMFRKDDVAFRDAFSRQLGILIENGTYEKLWAKYGAPHGDEMAPLLAKLTKAGDIVPSCE
ncbi:polar amino acid transport system substrate-binding protein [Bradyrhizobium sp. CIR18]|uniref:transporter substrate-binding domain-containing protein n=1 Tax=Bradyrhizobium sp. CIR18 TaxID=2663839 RepID=UPI001606D549|nr:transporter substrate-binding domain-containing protein [Bradyrhizobium sp. CIR18]MBB4367118.1 polar amino acid transport system substrate-binding protein [Bradyrhizobium sp. CIR18]